MRIAILGATSQIAKDLIVLFSENTCYELVLFARNINATTNWLLNNKINGKHTVYDYSSFGADEYFDSIINFVGIGKPEKLREAGESIFDITLKYDEMALNYVKIHTNCKYIFLSSGSVYNSDFDEPAGTNTEAVVKINNFKPQYWYGVSKLYAECRHRSLLHLPIVDIRIFNYFSCSIDMTARFLITDMIRSIENKRLLVTSKYNIVRDFIGPSDFYQIIFLILNSDLGNDVVDCYTKSPVEKIALLESMKKNMGLKYKIENSISGLNATGMKFNYYSKNRRAFTYGYRPSMNSLETVMFETKKYFEGV